MKKCEINRELFNSFLDIEQAQYIAQVIDNAGVVVLATNHNNVFTMDAMHQLMREANSNAHFDVYIHQNDGSFVAKFEDVNPQTLGSDELEAAVPNKETFIIGFGETDGGLTATAPIVFYDESDNAHPQYNGLKIDIANKAAVWLY